MQTDELVKRTIPTVIIEKRAPLREGLNSLLRNGAYKVVASVGSLTEIAELRAR